MLKHLSLRCYQQSKKNRLENDIKLLNDHKGLPINLTATIVSATNPTQLDIRVTP